jgi:hypothetical protein
MLAFTAGWGLTNITTKSLTGKLKVLTTEIVDSKICRLQWSYFQSYHICTGAINKVLNEAACFVSEKFKISCYTSNACIQ